MTPVLELNAIQVLGLSCFGIVIGVWLKTKLTILDRLNIPAPIIGGLIYALITLGLRDRVLNLRPDPALQDVLMIAFFTTIGLSASLKLLKVGGPQVAFFFLIASIGAVLQNGVGIALAKILGLNPLLGIVSGSVALTGGPATALAFGKTFEEMGVAGATTLGVASAMFGITAGGLMGGFIGGSLIRRHSLRADTPTSGNPMGPAEQIAFSDPEHVIKGAADRLDDESETEHSALMTNVVVIAIAMGIGTLISLGIEGALARYKVKLPSYIGAMIAASVIRNLDDHWKFANVSQRVVDELGNISLYIFIVMALFTLRLWELAYLAGPMLILLVAQIVLVWLMCVFLAFFLMGRDYQAAVMSGGFCGFMLGTTANAMACMDVLTRKYGPAPRAYIVVPIVGAFLIDFTNALIISVMANWFRA